MVFSSKRWFPTQRMMPGREKVEGMTREDLHMYTIFCKREFVTLACAFEKAIELNDFHLMTLITSSIYGKNIKNVQIHADIKKWKTN